MNTNTRILALIVLFAVTTGARADLDHIRNAAEAGNPDAQLELGILFDYGFNYKGNEIPALTWYSLSANQGNTRAAELRDVLKTKMTEKDISEAMEQVTNYKPKGAPGTGTYPTLKAPATTPETAAAPTPAEPTATTPAPAETPTATAPPPAEAAPIPETAPPAAQ